MIIFLAVRGGVASYLSILNDNFVYAPADVIVPGILEAGDVADVMGVLAPRPILLEDLVDGRDRVIPGHDLKSQLAPLYKTYQATSPDNLCIRDGQTTSDLLAWFREHLQHPDGIAMAN